jgi:hypothetical protein
MVSAWLRMNCSICASVCAAAEAGSSRPAEGRPAPAAAAPAHQLEAAHHALDVVGVGQEGRVDQRRGQRVGAGQAHPAAALRPQHAQVARDAVAEHRLAAVVDELADHEVQLQVGRGSSGWLRMKPPASAKLVVSMPLRRERHSKMPPTMRAARRRTTGRRIRSCAAR